MVRVVGVRAGQAKPTPKKRKVGELGETKEQGGQGESREKESEKQVHDVDVVVAAVEGKAR